MFSFSGEKLIYPAANRNKEPILQVLKRFLLDTRDSPTPATFLEISSGSGQHVAHFAPNFPEIQFQPSEVDKDLFGSISYYAQNCAKRNIKEPIYIDITKNLATFGFQNESIDYIYNANMIHISPYECTIGLFRNAGEFLKKEALMITYGPYSKDGVITPESNVNFDASLRERDPSWGIRDINVLVKLAHDNNLTLIDTIEMPANNHALIWKKE